MNRLSDIARLAAARFIPRFAEPIRCSGCGRAKSAELRMLSGPRVYLCEDCVARAARTLTPRRPPPDAVFCGFCREPRAPEEVTRAGTVAICANCLGRMELILTMDDERRAHRREQ